MGGLQAGDRRRLLRRVRAQDMAKANADELGVQAVPSLNLVYTEEADYVTADEAKEKNYSLKKLSGTKFRQMLRGRGDPRVVRLQVRGRGASRRVEVEHFLSRAALHLDAVHLWEVDYHLPQSLVLCLR